MREIVPAVAAAAIALAALLAAGSAARATPGGDLSVMTKGHYFCELPGNSSDPALFAGRPQPALNFDVIGDSSYRAHGTRGTYMLTGDRLRFTTGPLVGRQYHRVGTTFVRAVEADGTDGPLRCISSTQGIARAPGDDSHCKRAVKNKLTMRKRDDDLAC